MCVQASLRGGLRGGWTSFSFQRFTWSVGRLTLSKSKGVSGLCSYDLTLARPYCRISIKKACLPHHRRRPEESLQVPPALHHGQSWGWLRAKVRKQTETTKGFRWGGLRLVRISLSYSRLVKSQVTIIKSYPCQSINNIRCYCRVCNLQIFQLNLSPSLR
jgi:hypothetical protein